MKKTGNTINNILRNIDLSDRKLVYPGNHGTERLNSYCIKNKISSKYTTLGEYCAIYGRSKLRRGIRCNRMRKKKEKCKKRCNTCSLCNTIMRYDNLPRHLDMCNEQADFCSVCEVLTNLDKEMVKAHIITCNIPLS